MLLDHLCIICVCALACVCVHMYVCACVYMNFTKTSKNWKSVSLFPYIYHKEGRKCFI